MRILLHIGLSVLATAFLYLAYISGSIIAAYFGYPQRGGVGWGISVFYASFLMFPCALLSLSLYNKLINQRILAMFIGFICFVVFSTLFMGNQFSGGGWSYPYRYIFFQLCALAIFGLLLVAQLTSQGSNTPSAQDC